MIFIIQKNKDFKQLLNILTVGIMIEGSQILVFQPSHPLQMSRFRLAPWWNKSSVYFLRNKCLILINIIVNSTFLYIFDHQDSDEGNKVDTSPMKQFTTSGNYPIETLRNLNLYLCRKVSLEITEDQN